MAAMSSPQTALAAVIQCNQCENQLQQPHTLKQCLHSFCKTCLDGIPKKSKEGNSGWVCPECSIFSKEKDIRTNSFIEDLITISKGEKECDKTEKLKCKQCSKKDKDATARCIDCKIGLCDDCRIGHLQIPILSNHTIENIGKNSEKVIDKLLLCALHQTCPVEFNCKTCEKPTCLNCNLSDHNTHEIECVVKAIERLQPEIVFNSDVIKANTNIMETQIQTITREIEKTKESYASCRYEMDERLKTLINRFIAMKAQMEDEVTEQETVALDILENMKLNLENQLSLAKNLINLVEVTTDRAIHTSFLHEIQSGLFGKVQETSKTQQESVDFKVKVPEFKDEQNLKIKCTELQHFIGELSYNISLCTIDACGAIWTANEIMCENFKDIFDKEHKKEIEIDLDIKWCNRLGYFDDKLWIGGIGNGGIKSYNTEGELVNLIETEKEIIVIKKANNGDIIAAGLEGLYVTNTDCLEWKKLSDGKFCDLCVHSNNFSVLEYQNQKVKTFSLDTESADKGWSEESSFTVDTQETFNNNCTLLVDGDSNYLVCTGKCIFKYSKGMDVVSEQLKLTFWGFLCGVDGLGNLMITNFYDGEIYVSDLAKDLSSYNLTRICCNKKSKGEQLRDVIIDNNNNIWYLKGYNNNKKSFQLVKYKVI